MHAVDRAHDVGGRRVLEEEARGSRLQGSQHQFVRVEGGEHEHRGRMRLCAQQPRGGDPVEPRHPDVHQDDVGVVQVNGRQDASAVAGLADDLDLWGAGQHHRQSGTDHRVVVDDEDADRGGHGHRGMVARRTKSPIALVPC